MEKIPAKYKPKVWNKLDDVYPENSKMKQGKEVKKWVEVDKIVGTFRDPQVWFASRFLKFVKLLEKSEYNYLDEYPPVLFKINGEYFVASDGNHRCLAFKYLKIKRMVAEVVELS